MNRDETEPLGYTFHKSVEVFEKYEMSQCQKLIRPDTHILSFYIKHSRITVYSIPTSKPTHHRKLYIYLILYIYSLVHVHWYLYIDLKNVVSLICNM